MNVPEPVAALVVAVLALTLISGISPTADGKLYFGTKTTVPLDNRGDAYFVNLVRLVPWRVACVPFDWFDLARLGARALLRCVCHFWISQIFSPIGM